MTHPDTGVQPDTATPAAVQDDDVHGAGTPPARPEPVPLRHPAVEAAVRAWWRLRAGTPARAVRAVCTCAGCVPTGTARITGTAWRWVRADDYRHALIPDPRFIEEVRGRRRRTAWVTGAAAVAATAGGVHLVGPEMLALPAAAVAAVGTAVEVRARVRAGRALVLPGRKGTPAESVVTRAAAAAKLGTSPDPARYRLAQPVTTVDGGWSTIVQLPEGSKARKALGRESEFASALGVSERAVFFDLVEEHAGRLAVYVSRGDPFLSVQPSPLIGQAGPLDIWQGIPVGTDGRGRPVVLRIVDASLLVAGEPRAGKTVATNLIIAAFALSVTAKVHLFDGKGAGDHRPWRRVAHTAVKRSPARLLAHLRAMVEEMERRFELLDTAGKGTKLTPQLCRELGFDVELTVIDETRYYTADKECGEEIVALAVDIASRGPAAGMILLLASQRMTVDAIPGPLKGVCSLRWAMRCPDSTASNAVLGAGAAGRGYDASEIPRSHRGVGILDADGEDPVTHRSHLLDDEALAGIAEQAFALREVAGTLPPHSTPSRPSGGGSSILAVVARAFGEDERLHTGELVERLAGATIDGAPAEALGDRLGDRLREEGVEPHRQVWRHGRNRSGYHREDVLAALGRPLGDL